MSRRTSGEEMSPPAAIPFSSSQNARDVIPEVDDAFTMGVSKVSQLRPRSRVRRTREEPAPVPTYAVDVPTDTRHVPLAAKAPSPGRASGSLSAGTLVQVSPSTVW